MPAQQSPASPAKILDCSPTTIALKLFEYCRSNDWAGWDPYDALNSRIFKACKFLHYKYARLALTQFLKRSPVNFRPILLVPKEQNPKGLALFLSSAVKLTQLGLVKDDQLVRQLGDRLLNCAWIENGYTGWGYNFDWQTRRVLVSRGSPNIICTTFAGNALLDAYSLNPDNRFLAAAARAAKFILERLYDEISESESCFNYYLQAKARVHNANLLGAAFLCRVARITGNASLLDPALMAVQFSINRQNDDGSWNYGEAPSQRWVDNFHTGFNLCALERIGKDADISEFEPYVILGYSYYLRNFFLKDGTPKYYHNRSYPIDIHSAAQSIITLVELADRNSCSRDHACNVLSWAVSNMWDRREFFYYQRHCNWTCRIPYIRWSQAWMLLALATLIEDNTKIRRVVNSFDSAALPLEAGISALSAGPR